MELLTEIPCDVRSLSRMTYVEDATRDQRHSIIVSEFSISILDMASSKLVRSIRFPEICGSEIVCGVYSPESRTIFVGLADSRLLIISPDATDPSQCESIKLCVKPVALHVTSKSIMICCENGSLFVSPVNNLRLSSCEEKLKSSRICTYQGSCLTKSRLVIIVMLQNGSFSSFSWPLRSESSVSSRGQWLTPTPETLLSLSSIPQASSITSVLSHHNCDAYSVIYQTSGSVVPRSSGRKRKSNSTEQDTISPANASSQGYHWSKFGLDSVEIFHRDIAKFANASSASSSSSIVWSGCHELADMQAIVFLGLKYDPNASALSSSSSISSLISSSTAPQHSSPTLALEIWSVSYGCFLSDMQFSSSVLSTWPSLSTVKVSSWIGSLQRNSSSSSSSGFFSGEAWISFSPSSGRSSTLFRIPLYLDSSRCSGSLLSSLGHRSMEFQTSGSPLLNTSLEISKRAKIDPWNVEIVPAKNAVDGGDVLLTTLIGYSDAIQQDLEKMVKKYRLFWKKEVHEYQQYYQTNDSNTSTLLVMDQRFFVDVDIATMEIFLENLRRSHAGNLPLTAFDWDVLAAFLRAGLISASSFPWMIDFLNSSEKWDLLLIYAQFCPDLSESMVVRLFKIFLVLSESQLHGYSIHHGKLNYRTPNSVEGTELKDQLVSQQQQQQQQQQKHHHHRHGTSVHHLTIMALLLQAFWHRTQSFSSINLSETFRVHFSASMAPFLFRLLSHVLLTFFASSSKTQLDTSSNHNSSNNNEKSSEASEKKNKSKKHHPHPSLPLLMQDAHLGRVCVWMEALLDAHFITLAYHARDQLDFRQSLAQVLELLIGVDDVIPRIETFYGGWSHCLRQHGKITDQNQPREPPKGLYRYEMLDFHAVSSS